MTHSITINLSMNDISNALSLQLKSIFKDDDKKNGDLFFDICDGNSDNHVLLKSRKKISINKSLIDYLKEENIKFEINKN